jgi:hypothetical protein
MTCVFIGQRARREQGTAQEGGGLKRMLDAFGARGAWAALKQGTAANLDMTISIEQS